jgi:hypothetical protein
LAQCLGIASDPQCFKVGLAQLRSVYDGSAIHFGHGEIDE